MPTLTPLVLAIVLLSSQNLYAQDASALPESTADAPRSKVVLRVHEAKALQQEFTRLQQWYEEDAGTKLIKKRKPWRNAYAPLVFQQLAHKSIPIQQLPTQTIVVVHRNPKVQHAWVVLHHKGLLIPVADTPISTGRTGKFDHYITPVGVFVHTGDIVGYRAEGTKNKNGVKGLGSKGMRVWDFGWQKAYTGWLDKEEEREIRLALHSTDPELLEQRLGKPASKGCIRVHSVFNRFLDEHAILDADVIARDDVRAAKTVLSKKLDPTRSPGRYVVVIDEE